MNSNIVAAIVGGFFLVGYGFVSFFLRRLVNQMDKIETKVDRNERRMWRVMDKLKIADPDDGE